MSTQNELTKDEALERLAQVEGHNRALFRETKQVKQHSRALAAIISRQEYELHEIRARIETAQLDRLTNSKD